MTAAEQSAKDDVSESPRGCVLALAPDGQTKIWVKPPRGPGPWWRVKHPAYGHRLVKAATEDEAIRKFFEEMNPGFAGDLAWCKESMRLNGARVFKVAGTDPAPALQQSTQPAKKGEKS